MYMAEFRSCLSFMCSLKLLWLHLVDVKRQTHPVVHAVQPGTRSLCWVPLVTVSLWLLWNNGALAVTAHTMSSRAR